MRFDPKLIHPEEPPLTADGGLDLPADLAALGEQLSADAAHLAACYPAAGGEHRVAHPGRYVARSYATYAFALAGSALAALLFAVVAWQTQPGQPAVERMAARPAASSPTTMPTAVPALAAPRPGESVSLADLSGPELEALLDLLDRDPSHVTSISF